LNCSSASVARSRRILQLLAPKKIMSETTLGGKTEPKFSAGLFLFTIGATLAGLLGLVALLTPAVWKAQLAAGWPALLGVFLAVHVAAGVVEFFFHRYVLHSPLLPFLSYFYRQHTLHHALTRVGFQKTKHGHAVRPLLVDNVAFNRYPIVEEHQFEASYFPWYSLTVFAGLATLILAPLQLLFPTLPFFLAGYPAIAWSLCLYELIHAVEHWPQATWDRLIEHPTFGRFWRKAYAFHLRHHADIRCNEAISGIFGLPIVDLVLGTYIDPETLYRHGQSVEPKEFVSPRPRFAIIRWLDRMADHAVKKRRQRASAGSVAAVPAAAIEADDTAAPLVPPARVRSTS